MTGNFGSDDRELNGGGSVGGLGLGFVGTALISWLWKCGVNEGEVRHLGVAMWCEW